MHHMHKQHATSLVTLYVCNLHSNISWGIFIYTAEAFELDGLLTMSQTWGAEGSFGISYEAPTILGSLPVNCSASLSTPHTPSSITHFHKGQFVGSISLSTHQTINYLDVRGNPYNHRENLRTPYRQHQTSWTISGYRSSTSCGNVPPFTLCVLLSFH